MRIAFVDLMYSWPPHGGADVDVHQVALGLQARGHAVHLFGARSGITWERGAFDAGAQPFSATRLEFPEGLCDHKVVVGRMRDAVVAWGPDAIYIGDSFFLKPYLIHALAGYPQLARFYAHEVLCHKDILRWRDGGPCDKDYLRTPDTCRACALEHQRGAIRSGGHLAWNEEYMAAEAYRPEYWQVTREALRVPSALITYNEATAALLRPHAQAAVVIPGGVDAVRFPAAPPVVRAAGERKVILMAGRGEDPVKGAQVLLDAGRLLAATRDDFVIHITMPETTPGEAWFQPLPWCDHDAMVARYHAADICVVPSVWEEPFGMVALEAMACARPVVVSDVGGLRGTLEPEVSGLRFPRGDAVALADQLLRLLDDAPLREWMGLAARARVEAEFGWDRIIERDYLPLLQRLA